MDLKIKDVADLLNVSETTIRRWLTEEKIPAYRLNHQYRFSRTEIEAWVMTQRLGRTPPTVAEPLTKPSVKRGGSQQFSLFRAVHKGGVIFKVPGSSKEDVIRNAMHSFAHDHNLDADGLTNLLMDRENLQSTGLGNGIAIPHTRDYLLDSHQDLVVVAFPDKPLSYGALDGKPVHTLFFLFASDDKRHLHLLAKIAHLCALPQTAELLRSQPSKEVFLDFVKNWESGIEKVQEEATV
jgi:PTS system nitrogen regulatory IIA component